jgi:hypothetical protein
MVKPGSAAIRPCTWVTLSKRHGDSPAGEAPGDVLERLVRADGLVAVEGAAAGEQHDAGSRPAAAGKGERAGHSERGGADGDLVLVNLRGRA